MASKSEVASPELELMMFSDGIHVPWGRNEDLQGRVMDGWMDGWIDGWMDGWMGDGMHG